MSIYIHPNAVFSNTSCMLYFVLRCQKAWTTTKKSILTRVQKNVSLHNRFSECGFIIQDRKNWKCCSNLHACFEIFCTYIYIPTLLASDKKILLFYRIKKPNIIMAYSYFNHVFLGFVYLFFNLIYAKAFHWSIMQQMLRTLVIGELQA